MGHLKSLVVGAVLGGTVCGVTTAQAQSLGSFTWQLQPFCNRVTVTVTQNGSIYTLDGYDDQCGAPQRAPLVGMATPNPDGSIGLGFHIATSPGGKTVSVEARISLATVGGPWTDSAGNSGTLVLNGAAAGSARPAPPTGGTWGTVLDAPSGTSASGLRLRRSTLSGANAPALVVEWGASVPSGATAGSGIYSGADTGIAIQGRSNSGTALSGLSFTSYGVLGVGGSAGVYGAALGSGVGVRAEAESATGAALEIANGGVRVTGSLRPAFVHTASVGNIVGSRTVLDHPLLNGRADAIVVANYLFSSGSGVIAGGFNVLYDIATARWSVMRSDATNMPVGARFNVIVFNQ